MHDSITSAQLALLMMDSDEYVLAVCILELLQKGFVKDTLKDKNLLKLKTMNRSEISYEEPLLKFYNSARDILEPIGFEVAYKFLSKLFSSLESAGAMAMKGFFQRKFLLTEKGKALKVENLSYIEKSKDTFQKGLSIDVIKAIATNPTYKRLLPERFQPIFQCSITHKKSKDWFYAPWAAKNRYGAMRKAVRQNFGQF